MTGSASSGQPREEAGASGEEPAPILGFRPAEPPTGRLFPRQLGGIPFWLGVVIGMIGGVVVVNIVSEALWGLRWLGMPGHVAFLLLILGAIVLTCVRRTCSIGLGVFVSLLTAPVLVTGHLIEVVRWWMP